MLPQMPDVAGLGENRLLQLGLHIEVVFLDLLVVDVAEKLLDLRSIETREFQVEILVAQILQQISQHLFIPCSGDLVERNVQRFFAGFIHIDHRAGHLGIAKINGNGQALVTADDRHVAVHDQRIGKAKLPDAVLDLLVLLVPLLQLLAGVVFCRLEYADRQNLEFR